MLQDDKNLLAHDVILAPGSFLKSVAVKGLSLSINHKRRKIQTTTTNQSQSEKEISSNLSQLENIMLSTSSQDHLKKKRPKDPRFE